MKLTTTIPAFLKITEKHHKVYDNATKSFHLKRANSYSPIQIRIQFSSPWRGNYSTSLSRYASSGSVILTTKVIFHRLRRVCLACMCALLAGCGGFPQSDSGERAIFVPSPNHDARRPNFVILHDTTSDNVERPLKTLTDPAREVSAHYLIGRDGTVYQLVDEWRRAWHAGVSYWGGNTDLNSASIGIELDNTGAEPYSDPQVTRLLVLLRDLQDRYRIPASNFLGHGDVAPRRKVDPSHHFPWERLAKEGFGLWCRQQPDVPVAEIPDPWLALQLIGYDVSEPRAALAAFRRHFLGIDVEGEASVLERQLMQCLILEKHSQPAPQQHL
jgi:N-acetylmuramoyl-L-alanine amidase